MLETTEVSPTTRQLTRCVPQDMIDKNFQSTLPYLTLSFRTTTVMIIHRCVTQAHRQLNIARLAQPRAFCNMVMCRIWKGSTKVLTVIPHPSVVGPCRLGGGTSVTIIRIQKTLRGTVAAAFDGRRLLLAPACD